MPPQGLAPSSPRHIFLPPRRSRIRLPSSMSGLPALRCFIFFAADLFILFLPFPSVPRTDDSGFHPYIPLASAWMMNSCVNHEILRAARTLDTHRSLGHSAREGRSRAAKDKDDQPNSTSEVSSSATATL